MSKIIRIALFLFVFILLVFLTAGLINIFFFGSSIGGVLNFLRLIVIIVVSIHVSEVIYNAIKDLSLLKKILTLVIAAVFLMIGTNMVGSFVSEPPTPIVTTEKTKISLIRSFYAWENTVSSLNENPLVLVKEQNPTVVSSHEDITIKFRLRREPEVLEIKRWVDQDEAEFVNLENNAFKAPKEKGIYVYRLSTIWQQGSGEYLFSIDVK